MIMPTQTPKDPTHEATNNDPSTTLGTLGDYGEVPFLGSFRGSWYATLCHWEPSLSVEFKSSSSLSNNLLSCISTAARNPKPLNRLLNPIQAVFCAQLIGQLAKGSTWRFRANITQNYLAPKTRNYDHIKV